MQLTTCTVDLVRQRVVRGDQVIPLTSREADLLRYLRRHPSRVVPRDELLVEVWGYTDAVVSRATDNTIRRLREKIERDPRHPDHVLTVHGTGYRFEVGEAAAPGEAAPGIELGACRLDLHTRRLIRADGVEELSEPEARLLTALVEAGGETVPRDDLRRALWGHERRGARALDGLVLRVRRKVEPDPSAPTVICTERGGYRLA
ncbi:MAG: winged helix-turn-helix domain-containing protein, partial [Myxococcota bacterium]